MGREYVGLGLRDGHERRQATRRRPKRAGRDRRRGRRRNLLVSLATMGASFAIPPMTPRFSPRANVDVSVVSFEPIPAHRAYEDLVREAAATFDLDPALVRAVIQAESAFDASAVSRAGAQGLMQLMPALSDTFGVTDPFDPRQNILAGARYLKELLDRFDGNVELALASYNAGPTTVARYKRVPPFKETRNYVRKIRDLLKRSESAAAADRSRS